MNDRATRMALRKLRQGEYRYEESSHSMEVEKNSPEHIKLLRDAARTNPGGPESRYLRRLGIR